MKTSNSENWKELQRDYRRMSLEINRGSGKIIESLPNYDKAVIPKPKLVKYSLNMEHPKGRKEKAIAFKKALGYNKGNYKELMDNIHKNVGKYKAREKGIDRYGLKYEVVMNLTGPNGKSANVLTGWIIRDEVDIPTLTSTYVTNKKVLE